MAQHLYRDQIAACGGDGRCFVRNDDALAPFTGTLALSVLHLPSGVAQAASAPVPVALARGGGAFQWACLAGGAPPPAPCAPVATVLPTLGCKADGSDCVLIHNLTTAAGAEADVNVALLAAPGLVAASLPAGVTVSAVATGVVHADGSAEVLVTTAGGPALYVTLTTLAAGRFSENAFHVAGAGVKALAFLPFGGRVQLDVLQASLRVEHLGLYGA